MGYTHYFEPPTFTDETWVEFCRQVRGICIVAESLDIMLAWCVDEDGDTDPDFGGYIDVNGVEEESCENLFIRRTDNRWSFCKTRRRPYDAAVVAILTAGKKMGLIDWSSDGLRGEHEDGIALYILASQKEFPQN